MYKIVIVIATLILNLRANELIIYKALNIDTNQSCKFYEEKDYLQEVSRFKGLCREGFIDGNATIIHHNSHQYIGEFIDGYYHGKGRFEWDRENYIQGDFKKNYLTGNGYSYAYGNIAKGEFYKNLFTGYGLFRVKTGRVITVTHHKNELLQSAIYEEKAFALSDNPSKSLEFLEKSLEIREKWLKNHPILVDTYDNLIQILSNIKEKNSLKSAKEYSLKSLQIKSNLYDKNSETISTAYNNLALILTDLGENQEALNYQLKAITIDESSLPNRNSSALASLYSNASLIYREMGELKEAKKYLLKSLDIRENLTEINYEDLLIDYNTLSLIYQELNDLIQAKEYGYKSLNISKSKLGEQNPFVIKSSINIAMIHADLEEYTEAEELIEKVLLSERYFEKNSYELSVIYNNSALLYKEIGRVKKAKEYALKGLKISEMILDKNHPELATTYANVSLLYVALEDIKQAKIYAEKALRIRERNHNKIALSISYRDLSFIYIRLQNYPKAFSYYEKFFELFLESRKFLSQIDNRAKKSSLNRDSSNIYNFLDMSLLVKDENLSQRVINLWLRYKGEIGNSQNYLMAIKSRTQDKIIKSKIDKLIETERRYSNLFVESLLIDKSDENISKLEEEKSALEEYLSDKIEEYKESLKLDKIDSLQIAKELEKNELYIDFIKTDRSYYFFTLDRDNLINYSHLDKNSTIVDEIIDNYRKKIREFGLIALDDKIPLPKKRKELKNINQETRELGKELYTIFFDKIDKRYTNLVISPDGMLNLLPFESLITAKNHYLLEEKNISYISSGKAFLKSIHRDNKTTKSKDIVVFSNPIFDKNISKSRGSGELKSITNILKKLNQLDYSQDAIFITDIFSENKDVHIYPFTEENATKDNLFSKVKTPTILHLSTHSIYARDSSKTVKEPLLKSILALTGYNKWLDKNFGGLVTALEFSSLNLYNTELVFFASCQSSLGDIYSSEGVYGLNRASQIAGAKRVISTIWSIADKESALFAKKFYTNISNGEDYVKSLIESKRDMIKSGYHPFYWAGFIQNGIDKKEKNENKKSN